jgi:O-antigen/teichoic acid export membrane protein
LPNPDTSHHAVRRDRALRLTVAASVGAKVFSVLCTLAQVPIALHYLGAEGYGLWIALMSIYGLLNFLDFGLGVGMQQLMARAFGRDDSPLLRQTFSSGVAALSVLGLACLIIGLPLALWGDWGAWFKIADPQLRSETPAALAVIVAAFVIGLPGNAVVRLAAGLQLGWLHALWNAASNGATLLAVWLAARAGWSYLAFIAVAALLPATQNIGLWFQLRHRLGWHGGGPGFLPRPAWRELLRASFLFSFPQLSLAALVWLPPFAISLGAGAGAVTAFNLLQRLLSPLHQGQTILLTPLWPAYAEAWTRHDRPWLARAVRQSLLATGALTVGTVLVCWQAAPLITWWVGDDVALPATSLTWLTGLWFTLLMFGRHYLYYLVGIDRLPTLAVHSVLGFVGATGGLLLGSYYGGAGWALALGSLGYGVLGLPGMVVASHRPLPVISDPARS